MIRRKYYTVGFVSIPDLSDEWEDTGEGGLEFWLVVPETNIDDPTQVRGVCITGFLVEVTDSDVIVPSPTGTYIDNRLHITNIDGRLEPVGHCPIQAAVCIGATGRTPYHNTLGLWQPTYNDLTEDGQRLFDMLTELYGTPPGIVTALDT